MSCFEGLSPKSPRVRELNLEYFTNLEKGRSMKKRNKELFDSMKLICHENGFSRETQSSICVRDTKESEEWLKKISSHHMNLESEFSVKSIDTVFSTTEFFFNNEKYLIVVGIDDLEIDDLAFEFIENNAGIFTLFASKGIINLIDPKKSAGNIYNQFLFKEDVDSVRYVDFEDLSQYFQPFIIFKFIDETIYRGMELGRLSAYISLQANIDFYRSKDDELYLAIKDFILNGDKNIKYHWLAKSLCSKTDLNVLFMDFYKMLERLYSIPTANTLQVELGVNHDCLFELVKKIEKTTGWRKNEKDGLASLLNLLEDRIVDEMFTIIESNYHPSYEPSNVKSKILNHETVCEHPDSTKEQIDDSRNQVRESKLNYLCDYIYKVRNSYVHYREALDVWLDNEKLMALIKALLLAVDPIYVNLLERTDH